MFTGIVEEIGAVKGISKSSTGAVLKIKTEKIYVDAKLGDSIAMNGACLSVIAVNINILSFDVIPETLKRTTLSDLKTNDPVNLERSMKLDARIGGHFITGHIDYKGRINDIIKNQAGVGFNVSLPKEFSKFVVDKGSVALDGTSLTVAAVSKDNFTVYLIPHTFKNTALGIKKKGDFINVETDIIGKYAAKDSVKASDFQGILKEYGYM
ncbi:MAG: riboflavin synthase [Candidatus Omnitrophica bacterium CG02_land_8_20_14_3_00__42_8]|nr:MAG: riboflavin synthase [Candidatus Omnitrophica bacterium CG02_land_8_20_14_3_00__42_8]